MSFSGTFVFRTRTASPLSRSRTFLAASVVLQYAIISRTNYGSDGALVISGTVVPVVLLPYSSTAAWF